MKKLLTVLFSSVLAISLALPVLAQDTGSKAPATKSAITKKASKKHHGTKGATKTKKGTGTSATPAPKQ